MTRAGMVVVVAVGAMGAGCSTSSRSAARSMPPPATARAETAKTSGAQTTALCPMDVPGAHISTADTSDGEALTFTTSSSQPEARDQLRRSARAMADTFNGRQSGAPADAQHPISSGASETTAGSAGSTGSADASSEPGHAHAWPASHASVEDVGEGARLTVTPNDPADLDRLRSAVRMHVDRMLQSGTCATP